MGTMPMGLRIRTYFVLAIKNKPLANPSTVRCISAACEYEQGCIVDSKSVRPLEEVHSYGRFVIVQERSFYRLNNPLSFRLYALTQITASGLVVFFLAVYIEKENAAHGEQRTRQGEDQGKTHGHSRCLWRYKELR